MASSVAVGGAKILGSVLVVDGDRQAGHALAQDLRAHGYDVRAVSSFAEAVKCARDRHFHVLLTDLRVEGGDGMALVHALRETSPSTRPILMSAHATARESQRALDLGVAQVLSKPFDKGELLQAVDSAAQSAGGFTASLHGISIVDMLQMFHYSRRSLTLRVLGDVPAAIHMREGELVHAEYGERRGEDAVLAILKMPAGAVRTSVLESVKTTVQREFQTVMLDQLRRQDEQARDSQLPRLREVTDDPFGFLLDEEPLRPSGLAKTSVPTSRPPGEASSAGGGASASQCPFVAASATGAGASSGERPAVRPGGKKKTMEKIDIACERVVRALEGGVACGVIDLDNGNLLGIYNNRDHSEEQNALVAEATVDLFRGPNVQRIEAMVREQRGDRENGEHYFEEIQLASKHNLHFAKTLKGGRAVIMLVTKRSTSLGMGWAQLKAAIPVLERLIP